MVQLKCETDNGRYTFHAGRHTNTTNIRRQTLESLDAIVLEIGFSEYVPLASIQKFGQYGKFVTDNFQLRNPKPVYQVDLPASQGLRNVDNYGYGLTAIVTALEIALPFVSVLQALKLPAEIGIPIATVLAMPMAAAFTGAIGVTLESAAKVASYLSLSTFYIGNCGLRSAIAAQKLDGHIAPALKQRLGRKPEIFIEYGAGHADIIQYLRHKRLRDTIIKFHKALGFPLHDKTYIDKVKEITAQSPLNLGEILQNRDYATHREVMHKLPST